MNYTPGPTNAQITNKDGDNWTLVLERELAHPPERVWEAITDPEHLREWAPYDADASLAHEGATVRLTTVGAPQPHAVETVIKRADPHRLLEFNWGGGDTRWELEPTGTGTRLTLWAQINRNYVAMGAAGWHLCLDVLDRSLGDHPLGRIVGTDALHFEGWQRLNREYSQEFGVEPKSW